MTILAENKKAGFDYEFLEKLEAGIKLLGFEVKALRDKKGGLDGSYITIQNGEPFMLNSYIPPYQPANTPKDYDSRRARKLLMTKKEIYKLTGLEKQKGLTIVPFSVYTKNGKIKIGLAVARGKKKYDKRESIKKRDVNREVRREFADR